MKKHLIITLLFFVLLHTAAAGFSAPTTIKLGGANQHRAVNTSTTFTIKNTGNETLTGFSFSSTASAQYKVGFSPASVSSLLPNQESIITINGWVPLDLDAVDRQGKKIAIDLGTVTITASELGNVITKSLNLQMEAENNLRIDDLEFEWEDERDRANDGDRVGDFKPNDDITLTMKVENRLSDRGDCDTDGDDCDIENVEADFTIDEREWDWDDNLDFGDIRADDDSTESLDFTVDKDADNDRYPMVIELTGEDENGARHGEYWEVDLNVKRPRDEITIRSVSLRPSTLACEEKAFLLEVDIENTGRDNQKRAALEIKEAPLNINEIDNSIEIDEGDRDLRRFQLKVPADTKPGTYHIDVIAFNDEDDETDREIGTLRVEECVEQAPEEPPEMPQNNSNIVILPPNVEPSLPPVTGQPIEAVQKEETNFFGSPAYIALLIVAIVIVLLLILLLVVMLFKK